MEEHLQYLLRWQLVSHKHGQLIQAHPRHHQLAGLCLTGGWRMRVWPLRDRHNAN